MFGFGKKNDFTFDVNSVNGDKKYKYIAIGITSVVVVAIAIGVFAHFNKKSDVSEQVASNKAR